MSKTYDNATVELAMTLSTLAYVEENRTATQQQMINEINAALEQAGYKDWQVVSGPALNATATFSDTTISRRISDVGSSILANHGFRTIATARYSAIR